MGVIVGLIVLVAEHWNSIGIQVALVEKDVGVASTFFLCPFALVLCRPVVLEVDAVMEELLEVEEGQEPSRF